MKDASCFGSTLTRVLLAMLLCAAIPVMLSAQSTTVGRISGTVSDTQHAVVAGATVTATSESTGLGRSVITDASGYYVVTNLPVGRYSVSAEQKGFGKEVSKANQLDADGHVTVDFVLKPGRVTETVEVTATGEAVNTVSGEISRVVDEKQVQDAALNARNYMQLVSLVPGVVLLDEDQIAQTYGINITNQSVNGGRVDQNLLTVDGGYNLDSGSNGSPINNVGIDFIQEFSVKTSNFSAEYGRNSSSAINVVTRSGGNQFHGGIFEYVRNDALDAITYFAPVCTAANPCLGGITDGRKLKPILRFNDFGGDIGGPIWKNKLFFFAGEEQKLIRQNASPFRQTLPGLALLNGNFSSVATVLKVPAGAPAGCTITANVMSPQCITPNGQAFANLYKNMGAIAASFTGGTGGNNAIYQPFQPYAWRQDLQRLDFHITDKQSMYFRYIHDNLNVGLPQGGFASATALPSEPQTRKRPGYSYQLSHTYLISPTLVNQASITAAWNAQRFIPYGDVWLRSTYGMTYPQVFGTTGSGRFRNSIPNVTLNGFAGVNGQNNALLSPTTDISPNDTLTWTHGNHTLKTGFQVTRNRKDQNARSIYAGQVTFQSSGNTNSTGNSVADMLMGNFQDYQEASADPVGLFRFTQYSTFATDNWKVMRNLSLELGGRYEYRVPTYTQGNDLANFDPSTYDPAKAVTVLPNGNIDATKGGNILDGMVRAGSGVPSDQLVRYPNGNSATVLAVPAGAPRGFYQPQSLFAPRVGFAWSPFGNNKTSIRGGYGIFYDTAEGNIIFPLLSNQPFIQSVDVTSGNIANPLAGKAAAQSVQGNISAIDPHFKMAYTESYSLSLQQELPSGMFLELAYVGNEGKHEIRQPDINQVPFATLVANAPATGTIAGGLRNSLRPYKGYSAINMFLSDGISNYNALQTYLTKRRGNLNLSVGYTWARTLTDASGFAANESDNIVNLTNKHYSYGPAGFMRKHVFTSTYSYTLPFYRDQHGFVGHLAGGWQMSGITRAQTGAPLTANGNNPLASNLRADYLGGGINIGNPTISHWFNTAAFAIAPGTRLGTAGVGTINGPGLFTWDMSLRKDIAMPWERLHLRFEGDMFNILNHTNFRNPNTSLNNLTTFGTVSTSGPPRQIQFAMKLNF